MLEIVFNKGNYESILDLKINSTAAFREQVKTAMEIGLQRVEMLAKRNAPYKTRTLSRSITHRVDDSGGQIVGSVGTNVVYAKIQELGGTIRPKNGPYLKFKTPDGKWHSVKSVTIKGRQYLSRAVTESHNYIRDQFKKYLIEDAIK